MPELAHQPSGPLLADPLADAATQRRRIRGAPYVSRDSLRLSEDQRLELVVAKLAGSTAARLPRVVALARDPSTEHSRETAWCARS